MKSKMRKHEIDSVFVLLLFTLFAGCILMVLLLGASSYEKLVKRDTETYNARTGVQYIAAKLRHGDASACVQAGSFADKNNTEADEIPTLYLGMSAEGEFYYTKIYYYDGYLRELLCMEEDELEPEDGQEVLRATSFSVEQNGALLTVSVGDEEGEVHTLSLAIRSTGEVRP